MSNRLAHETSPYLLQHADNPVDWVPWSSEAFLRARELDRPLLLSIGYSACHWCHVMAHESFEDEAVARLMNERYVCIKVDREERPDVDQIYQNALQLTGEGGGWPLTMWLLPDGRPYFGGTYFPPQDRYGRPSFSRVLLALSEAYLHDRQKVEEAAAELRRGLQYLVDQSKAGAGTATVQKDGIERCAARLGARLDRRHGGFAGAPKFPSVPNMNLLLRGADRARRAGDTATADDLTSGLRRTLDKMAEGGIYDQLGGGFHRYSTDEEWLVPHFEKMLYDQGLLLRLYAEVGQLQPSAVDSAVLAETAAYLERDLRAPEGGLYTAEDADSEGVEGKFYVWTPAEVEAVCGKETADVLCRFYDVREGGNWRDPHGHGPVGASILHIVDRALDERERSLWIEGRRQLLAARSGRVRPGLDDKVLASCNGLALAGQAEAGRVLGSAPILDGARRTARFLLDVMRGPDGRLRRTWKRGHEARLPGTLDDHAYVADGLIALYEATGEGEWLEAAFQLTELAQSLFFDATTATYYLTAADDEALVVRPTSLFDAAVPSGMGIHLLNLGRLAAASGRDEWRATVERVTHAQAERAFGQPFGMASLLCALDLAERGVTEIVLAGPDTTDLARTLGQVYLANRILVRAGAPSVVAPLVAGKEASEAAAFVCRNFACDRPVGDASTLRERLLK